MKIFKWEINFKKAENTSNSETVTVDKNLFEQFVNVNSKFLGVRPQMDPKETVGDEEILIPLTPIPLDIIYDAARYSDVLRTIHQSLRKEIFRQGYEIKEAFASQCQDCGKEFDNYTEICDECEGSNMREPEVEQRKRLEKFVKNMNDNRQDILKISEELNDDFEVIDDGYLLAIMDYYFNQDGEIIAEIPVEFLRADPRWMRLIADKKGRPGKNQSGDTLFVCPEHRNAIIFNQARCKCGKQALPAHFRSEEPDGKYVYYGADEVLHKSKYNPSLTYGFSLIYPAWMKVVTLMNMDVYIKSYYSKQRPPRGLLFVDTPNMNTLEKAWAWMTDQWKKNPHQIPPIAVERTQGGRGNMVDFIDFMKTPEDMQFIEMRNEYRRQIGALYGVMPLFQADMSQSGGLNNEGLQITVTNRAVKDGQTLFNEEVYPWVCDKLGVTDYTLTLIPSEEEDKKTEEELWGMKIDNAKKMQDLGFDITLNEDNDFEYDPIDEPVEPMNPMGGVMGAGGLPPSDEPDQEPPEVGGFDDEEPMDEASDATGEPAKPDVGGFDGVQPVEGKQPEVGSMKPKTGGFEDKK